MDSVRKRRKYYSISIQQGDISGRVVAHEYASQIQRKLRSLAPDVSLDLGVCQICLWSNSTCLPDDISGCLTFGKQIYTGLVKDLFSALSHRSLEDAIPDKLANHTDHWHIFG